MIDIFPTITNQTFEYSEMEVAFGVDSVFVDLLAQGIIPIKFTETYQLRENQLLIHRRSTVNEDKMIVENRTDGYFLDTLQSNIADGLNLPKQEAECVYPVAQIFEQTSRNTKTLILELGSDYVITQVEYNNVVNKVTGEVVTGHCRTVFKQGLWIIEQKMDSSKFKFAYKQV
jgi:hypothetical protein